MANNLYDGTSVLSGYIRFATRNYVYQSSDATGSNLCAWLNIEPGHTYRITGNFDTRFRVATVPSHLNNDDAPSTVYDPLDNNDSSVIGNNRTLEITSADDEWEMVIFYWSSGGTVSEDVIRTSIIVEDITPYTVYEVYYADPEDTSQGRLSDSEMYTNDYNGYREGDTFPQFTGEVLPADGYRHIGWEMPTEAPDHSLSGDTVFFAELPTKFEPPAVPDDAYGTLGWRFYPVFEAIETVTVSYLPGEHGSFEPQSYEVYSGSITPPFDGVPQSDSTQYTFTRWLPEIAVKATENISYVAQWGSASEGFITPVFDRVAADIANAITKLNLFKTYDKNGYIVPTDDIKGEHNYTDVNRFEHNAKYLSDTFGLDISGIKTDWDRTDTPTLIDSKRWESYANLFRDYCVNCDPSYDVAIPSPPNMPYDYEGINAFEHIEWLFWYLPIATRSQRTFDFAPFYPDRPGTSQTFTVTNKDHNNIEVSLVGDTYVAMDGGKTIAPGESATITINPVWTTTGVGKYSRVVSIHLTDSLTGGTHDMSLEVNFEVLKPLVMDIEIYPPNIGRNVGDGSNTQVIQLRNKSADAALFISHAVRAPEGCTITGFPDGQVLDGRSTTDLVLSYPADAPAGYYEYRVDYLASNDYTGEVQYKDVLVGLKLNEGYDIGDWNMNDWGWDYDLDAWVGDFPLDIPSIEAGDAYSVLLQKPNGFRSIIVLRSETPFEVGDTLDGYPIINVIPDIETRTSNDEKRNLAGHKPGIDYLDMQIDVVEIRSKIAPINTSYWFSWISVNTKQIVGIENIDPRNIVDTSGIFWRCTITASLDLSSWDMPNLEIASDMFNKCGAKEINLSNWVLHSDAFLSAGAFDGCYADVVNLSNWDLSNIGTVRYNRGILIGCPASTIIVSGWNTSGITDMSGWFLNCKNVTNLDLANWDTSSVTNMGYMFENCYKLSLIDLANWDTSSVKNMGYMFSDCVKLSELDLSGWDTSNVVYMASMFDNCPLTSLNAIFDTSSCKGMDRVFYACEYLSYDASYFDVSNVSKTNHDEFNAGAPGVIPPVWVND